jgi:multisubunit Na+/H+ antiporter MnhG subunit
MAAMRDPLAATAIVALLVLGAIMIIDLADGEAEPVLLALVVSVLSPIIPALIVRYSRNGKRSEDEKDP